MCGGTDIIEQRTYLKYCNGAEMFDTYDPARRRLQNLTVNAKAGTIMGNLPRLSLLVKNPNRNATFYCFCVV